jgi:hypothetical protein
MPRLPRQISIDEDGLYHLRGQTAGPLGDYPLLDPEVAQKLEDLVRHYTSVYCCEPAAFQIMGDHYHLEVWFEAYRELPREELEELAERFYAGNVDQPYRRWKDVDWLRFNRRLFNVSELMRNVQSAFARWYNRRERRRGPVWAGRFRSTRSDSLLETVYYIELNPVRAGLTRRPELAPHGSCRLRHLGQDDWLLPLEVLMGTATREEAEQQYWVQLYWRGTRSSKEGDAVLAPEVAAAVQAAMQARGIERGGGLQRQPVWSRGEAVGSRKLVAARLDQLIRSGHYGAHREPIPLPWNPSLYALRRQRRLSWEIAELIGRAISPPGPADQSPAMVLSRGEESWGGGR